MGKKLGLDKAYSNLLTTINKNSPSSDFLNRRLTLSTGKNEGMKTDIFKNRRLTLSTPTSDTIKKATKSIFKRSPIGRIIDAGVKIGAGVGAGYSYAKEKFKPDNKMGGGMAENRGMGLQDESMKPGKIMKAKYGKEAKIKKVMKEFKKGELHIGKSKKKVKNKKQAIAIALSEARKGKA